MCARKQFPEGAGSGNGDLDFRALFDASPSLYLVLKPDLPKYTILWGNHAYLSTTKTTMQDIVGRGIFEVFPDNPDDSTAVGESNLRASLQRVVTLRRADAMAVLQYDIPKPESEGGGFEVRHWSPLNTPVFGSGGELLYILHRVEDATEFVELSKTHREESEVFEERSQRMQMEILRRSRELDDANKSLRTVNDRLQELDRAKTVFFSNISHEFRTPITLLLGPIESLLADASLQPGSPQREAIEIVHRNALRLLKLVNALLDFSRIEAGRMRATFSSTNLSRLTAELAGMFQSSVEKSGLRLLISCDSKLEPAYVDPTMWEKIVLNLVSNAVKFTFEGEIEVRLCEVGGLFELSVRDTGTGIPEAELPHIFQRFHRVDGARSRSHEGTGIGLSLVRELIRLHGGDVTVQSQMGTGTTFTVTIPKGHAHLPAEMVSRDGIASGRTSLGEVYVDESSRWVQSTPPAESENGAGEITPAPEPNGKPRVLVVDDNKDLRAFIASLLEPHHQVETAPDGREALNCARANLPDLILSDVMMPNLDGHGLVRAIRADPALRGLPVILLSARAGEESAIEGLESGADDFLVKPFSAKELLARVRSHLLMAGKRREWTRELERINEELDAFSYSVSHDLKAPLRTIAGFTQILAEEYGDKLEGEARHFINRILSGVHRMSALIEDLLSLSRLSRVQINRRQVNLSLIANEVIEELRGRDANRRVEVHIADGLETHGDERLIRIVLENLLGNAWKFTGRRTDARIEIGAAQWEGRDCIVIRDNGAGINLQFATKMFAPFQRFHDASQFEGTGIGLATVRRIIERHKGGIWVESAPNEGAAFYFSFSGRE